MPVLCWNVTEYQLKKIIFYYKMGIQQAVKEGCNNQSGNICGSNQMFYLEETGRLSEWQKKAKE